MPQQESEAVRRLRDELQDAYALAKHLAQATTALREGHALLYAEHRALCHCVVGAVPGIKAEQLRYQASIRFANSRLRFSLRQQQVIVVLATHAGVDAFGGLYTALGLVVPKNHELLVNLQKVERKKYAAMAQVPAGFDADADGASMGSAGNRLGGLDNSWAKSSNLNRALASGKNQESIQADAPPASPSVKCFMESQNIPANSNRADQVQRIMERERSIYGAPSQRDDESWPEEMLRIPSLATIMVKVMGFVMSSRIVATGWRLRYWLSSSIRSLAMNVPPEIFMFGGTTADAPNAPLATVEGYNVALGCWKPLESMREGRTLCSTVTHGGYIYIIGGSDGRKTLPLFDRFDVTKKETEKKWEQLRPMHQARKQCAACAVSGSIYVIDGLDRKMGKYRLENYDIVTGSWSAVDVLKAEVPIIKVAAVLGGRLYFIGISEGEPKVGMDTLRTKSLACRSFHPFQRTAHTLKKLPSMEAPPFNEIVGSTSSRDKVYVFGNQISLMCIFNAKIGSWDPPVDAKRGLPITVRAVRTAGSKSRSPQLVHMGYVNEQDPESPGDASNVFALQTWTLLPPYKAFRDGAGLAVLRY